MPRQPEAPCRLAMMAALCLLAGAAAAVDIERLEVRKDGKMFRLLAQSQVAAPPEFVFGILTDFDNFHRLSAGMVVTRYLSSPDSDVPVVYTLVNSCAWIFCTRFEKVERIWPVSNREIVTVADPERSDFKHYATRWQLEATATGTRMRFEGAMLPDFWVPPMLGTWILKKKLSATALEMGEIVEYLYATGTPLADLPATPAER